MLLHDSLTAAIAMASRLLTLPCSTIPWSKRRGTTPLALIRGHGSQTSTGRVELQRRLGLRGKEFGRGVLLCRVKAESAKEGEAGEVTTTATTEMDEEPVRSVKQVALWVMAAVYTSYLFLLPYAPVTILSSIALNSQDNFENSRRELRTSFFWGSDVGL